VCGGDLLSFVRKRQKLNEQTAKSIFRQIMDALYHIHSNNIVHRDIKLDNILIDLSNNIKICDFGVSRQIRKGEIIKHQCGTPAYIAPEILRNEVIVIKYRDTRVSVSIYGQQELYYMLCFLELFLLRQIILIIYMN
jgi:serine/threonine protein kinase